MPVVAVYIHGMFGFGQDRPLFNIFPWYWPIHAIEAANPSTNGNRNIFVTVGSLASNYDRACEVYAQLKGGTVDYGYEHASENGHGQFGKTYKGIFPEWDEQHPIHLIGHSLGSTTAIQLYQMMCQDILKVNSNSKWVKSITSIAGPLGGSTIVNMLGLRIDESVVYGSPGHGLGITCGLAWKLQRKYPLLEQCYDYHMPQWSTIPDFGKLTSPYYPLNHLGDTVYVDNAVSYRMRKNQELVEMDKVHLFSVATFIPYRFKHHFFQCIEIFLLFPLSIYAFVMYSSSYQYSLLPFGLCVLYFWIKSIDIATSVFMIPLSYLLRYYTRNLHNVPESWILNDGVVNTYSMLSPHSTNDTPKYEIVSKFIATTPGTWQVLPISKNHFCGTNFDKNAQQLYVELFQTIKQL